MFKAVRGFYDHGKISLKEDVDVKRGEVVVIFWDDGEEDVMTGELFKAKAEALEGLRRGEAIDLEDLKRELLGEVVG
ncbi:MAG: hypothetical protein J7J76_06155 [Candidatus Latescibacteria bacterium]|nr:hypothetical protein [Candidatus Latescibacterota bacterium]